jgi:hypothetical protein
LIPDVCDVPIKNNIEGIHIIHILTINNEKYAFVMRNSCVLPRTIIHIIDPIAVHNDIIAPKNRGGKIPDHAFASIGKIPHNKALVKVNITPMDS